MSPAHAAAGKNTKNVAENKTGSETGYKGYGI